MPPKNGLTALPRAARALTQIGDETTSAIEELVRSETPLFDPIDDPAFKTLADVFLTRGWTDAPVARVLRAFSDARLGRHLLKVAQLVGWVESHSADAADLVLECINTIPPLGVSLTGVLSRKGSQKVVFAASWRGRSDVVLKKVIGSRESADIIIEREGIPHPFSLSHPNIIETWQLTNEQGDRFLIEPRLDSVLRDDFPLGGLQNTVTVLIDVSSALKYVHDHGYVHGDVKPDNIGRRRDQYILLDFGICRPAQAFTPDTTPTGSLRTRPPELLLGESFDSQKFDVWALGATIFNFAVGRFPFIESTEDVPRIDNPRERSRFEVKLASRVRRNWKRWVAIDLAPAPLRSALAMMLTRDATKRPSVSEVVKHVQENLSMFIPTRVSRDRATKNLPPREELIQIQRFLGTPTIAAALPRHRRDALLSRLNELRRTANLTLADLQLIDLYAARLG
jgi:serine/threonine protein kinase